MISVEVKKIMGNAYLGLNRLAKFRSRPHERILDDSFLLEEEKKGYGYETGDRFLPYKWQDLYSRERREIEVSTIVMENDHVRAEFYPRYGMRLASLIQKDGSGEILFSNPVLQFGNLAIRRAWFSGGIEWNFGQLGHSFTSCEPLFVSRMKDENGEEFLRAFEYERQKGLYWSIDFHLGRDDRFLFAYGRFVNPRDLKQPFYYWTNIAVPEEKGMRIYSGTNDVIFIDSRSLMSEDAVRVMAHGRLPYLGIKEGVDYTYPENFTDYSNEYFFQNPARTDASWEAAAYRGGRVFFDRCDEALRYHKMFCWGGEPGGRHWRDYLSEEGKGDYVELQAGFSPTQVHGEDIAAHSMRDFIQCFGLFTASSDFTDGDYDSCRNEIYGKIESLVPQAELAERKQRYAASSSLVPGDFLQYGSGYGALEAVRDSSITPDGFYFPHDSIKDEERVWLGVLEGRTPPPEDIPSSYMTDERWKPYIEKLDDKNFSTFNILGVMALEAEKDDEAGRYFRTSLSLKENAFAYRCLAVMRKMQGMHDEAVSLMKKAVSLDSSREMAEEYASLLIDRKMYGEAWEYYLSLDEDVRSDERLSITMMPAACALGRKDFLKAQFERDFAVIREGERNYTDSYFAYQAMNEAEKNGIPYTQELVRRFEKENRIPFRHEFRLG